MANQTTEYEKIEEALKDKYEIDGMLGKGVFGHVYKANCREDGETYAIKIIRYGDEKNQKYQKREVELLTRMELSKGSNVIKYFKSWFLQLNDGLRLCIQMEMCSLNLHTFVSKYGTTIIQNQGQPRFYQQVFQQILNGLVSIHSIRWVHRDIHPGNILIVNPNPQRIIDIHVKIADFGLARRMDIEIKFNILPKGTINPEVEKLTPFHLTSKSTYMAPELKSHTYDFKVDVYSAGMVLYFISRFPVQLDSSKLKSEIEELKRGERDIKECLYHKDDEKLSSLIKKLVQEDPKARFNAQEAMDYMLPEAKNSTDANESMSTSLAKDSTDSSEASKTKFLARREEEHDARLCFLNEFTLSALRAEVERRTRVKAGRQVLRQEYAMKNGEKMRIIIECDEDVENIFQDAVQEHDIVIVVIEQRQEDNNIETGQISSGDTIMVSE